MKSLLSAPIGLAAADSVYVIHENFLQRKDGMDAWGIEPLNGRGAGKLVPFGTPSIDGTFGKTYHTYPLHAGSARVRITQENVSHYSAMPGRNTVQRGWINWLGLN